MAPVIFFLEDFFAFLLFIFIHISTLRLIRDLSPETYISSIIIGWVRAGSLVR